MLYALQMSINMPLHTHSVLCPLLAFSTLTSLSKNRNNGSLMFSAVRFSTTRSCKQNRQSTLVATFYGHSLFFPFSFHTSGIIESQSVAVTSNVFIQVGRPSCSSFSLDCILQWKYYIILYWSMVFPRHQRNLHILTRSQKWKWKQKRSIHRHLQDSASSKVEQSYPHL